MSEMVEKQEKQSSSSHHPAKTSTKIVPTSKLTAFKKRKTARGVNYSPGDMILLTSLLSKYKRFIMAKCHTYMDVATKAEAWKQFTSEYNATAEVKRTMKTLQTKVKNMKTRGTCDITQLPLVTIGKEPVAHHSVPNVRKVTTDIIKPLLRGRTKETAGTSTSSAHSETIVPISKKVTTSIVKEESGSEYDPAEDEDDSDEVDDNDDEEEEEEEVEPMVVDTKPPVASPLPSSLRNRKFVDRGVSPQRTDVIVTAEEHEIKMDVLDLKKSNLMLERCLLQKEHEEKMAIFALKKRNLELQNDILLGKINDNNP